MKKLTFLILFISIASICLGQGAKFEWVKFIEDTAYTLVIPNYSIIDDNENIVVHGELRHKADFDPGNGQYYLNRQSNRFLDRFISKYDKNGSFKWALIHGGQGTLDLNGMATDKSGNLYITGAFTDTIDFDLGAGVHQIIGNQYYSAFVLKLDSSGKFIWVKTFGEQSIYFSHGGSITVDDSNNIWISGGYEVKLDFDPGPDSSYLYSKYWIDGFLLKLDSSGNFILAKSIGGDHYDYISDIKSNRNGIFISGIFSKDCDVDPDTARIHLLNVYSRIPFNYDAFICRFNSKGNFKWVVQAGNPSDDDFARIIHITDNGTIFAHVASYADTVKFSCTNGIFQFLEKGNYLLKLDSSGNFVHAVHIPYKNLVDVLVDTLENIYCIGRFQYLTDFDLSDDTFLLEPTKKSYDAYIVKIDSGLNFIYAKHFRGSSKYYYDQIRIRKSHFTKDNGLITIGEHIGLADFNTEQNNYFHQSNPSPSGSAMFIHKMEACNMSYSTDTISQCGIYFAPNYIQYDYSGTHIEAWDNQYGCDSLVKKTRYVSILDSSFIFKRLYTLEVRYKQRLNGASYQWLDCTDNLKPIPGANGIEYNPPRSGSYSVAISKGECIDTLECVDFLHPSGIADNTFYNVVSIYPNPGNVRYSVDFGNTEGEHKLIIREVSGKIISEINCPPTKEHEFTIVGDPGIYFVEVINGDQSKVFKVIKQ